MSVEKKLLIVENDYDMRAGIEDTLQGAGIPYDVAFNGLEGTEKMSEATALVLSDIDMEQLDGFGVLRYAQKNFPRLRVILMTGAYLETYRERGLREGAEDVISKPFSRDYLLNLAEEALKP